MAFTANLTKNESFVADKISIGDIFHGTEDETNKSIFLTQPVILIEKPSSFVASRLKACLGSEQIIAEVQYGLRRGKSTLVACEIIPKEIEKWTRIKNRPLYAVFVDYRAAFDTASRREILGKLSGAGVAGEILELPKSILQVGLVSIENGVSTLEAVTQATGVAQGDNSSRLLYSVSLSGLPQLIQEPQPTLLGRVAFRCMTDVRALPELDIEKTVKEADIQALRKVVSEK